MPLRHFLYTASVDAAMERGGMQLARAAPAREEAAATFTNVSTAKERAQSKWSCNLLDGKY